MDNGFCLPDGISTAAHRGSASGLERAVARRGFVVGGFSKGVLEDFSETEDTTCSG